MSVLRLKISGLIKPSRLSMLPPGPVLHVVIRAQKRHQAGTAWRRQTDRRTVAVTLKSVDLHVLTFFASNAVVNSARSGGVLDGERSYKVKWPRPDPEGEVDRDSAFSWLAELYYSVYMVSSIPCMLYPPFHARYYTPRFAHRRVRCGKIVENKLVCLRLFL
ncbi:hypothetical protein ALC57_10486 [Trachymyrmex cornetzi]|uniref:Uncharacterized protein n=1 Tax=Trachymyrmex cornetzi TaxID=471704 RepID=A0A195DWQ3_9HYME|nr:hypothetical protein ALC57_10486 [Trachymyrmex cornetzi]